MIIALARSVPDPARHSQRSSIHARGIGAMDNEVQGGLEDEVRTPNTAFVFMTSVQVDRKLKLISNDGKEFVLSIDNAMTSNLVNSAHPNARAQICMLPGQGCD